MKIKACWCCRRTAKQVREDCGDKDLDEDFALCKSGNIYTCLICEGVITNCIDNYMKEKFGRGDQ
jgi:hypothetical protein